MTPQDELEAKYRYRKDNVSYYAYKETHSFHNITVVIFLFALLTALAWAMFG